jgi:hypothetical protein
MALGRLPVASPRVLGYDDLHQYLETMAETEQDLGEEYAERADEQGWRTAHEHWGAARACRELITHIEHELEWNRG